MLHLDEALLQAMPRVGELTVEGDLRGLIFVGRCGIAVRNEAADSVREHAEGFERSKKLARRQRWRVMGAFDTSELKHRDSMDSLTSRGARFKLFSYRRSIDWTKPGASFAVDTGAYCRSRWPARKNEPTELRARK
jgi:muconolactone delta-isomerase